MTIELITIDEYIKLLILPYPYYQCMAGRCQRVTAWA